MTKKEVAKELRAILSKAIRRLPDDVGYKSVSMHTDFTSKRERDHEERVAYDDLGSLHIIELTVEERTHE